VCFDLNKISQLVLTLSCQRNGDNLKREVLASNTTKRHQLLEGEEEKGEITPTTTGGDQINASFNKKGRMALGIRQLTVIRSVLYKTSRGYTQNGGRMAYNW